MGQKIKLPQDLHCKITLKTSAGSARAMAISSEVKFGCRMLSAHCQISCNMLAKRKTEQCL